MRVRINTPENNLLSFDVHKNDKIMLLKEKIFMRSGVPILDQRLVYDHKRLDDEHTIDYYNILEGSIVFVFIHNC